MGLDIENKWKLNIYGTVFSDLFRSWEIINSEVAKKHKLNEWFDEVKGGNSIEIYRQSNE